MQKTFSDRTTDIRTLQRAGAFTDYSRTVLAGRARSDEAWPDTEAHRIIKAAVISTDPAALRNTSAEFVKLAQQGTLIGSMRPYFAEVPPYVPVIDLDDDGPGGAFVSQGAALPAAAIPTTALTSDVGRLGEIVVFDQRVVGNRDPRARGLFERMLLNRTRRLEDREFLSSTAAIAGERPAGILATAPEIGGGSPSSFDSDLQELFAYVANGRARAPFLIASARVILYLATLNDGTRFPNARVDGTGDIAGIRLLASPEAGNKLILLDAARLVVVDDLLEVRGSTAASLQMADNPTNNARTGTGASLISAFQTNSLALSVVRYLWWGFSRSDAVVYVEISELSGSPS